jgi:hypothetical protein
MKYSKSQDDTNYTWSLHQHDIAIITVMEDGKLRSVMESIQVIENSFDLSKLGKEKKSMPL